MRNELFEKCLANVDPETREEVRRNMDAVANCDQSKARQYSENRILAIPADVNEDGEVFYLNSDLGTADDEHNGLSGEIEMAYCNGYGQALLDNKNPWHKVSEEPEEKGMYLVWIFDYLHPITMCFGDYGWDNPTGEEITHWMPIPEIKEEQK